VPISVTTIFVYNDTIFRSLWWRYNQVLLYFVFLLAIRCVPPYLPYVSPTLKITVYFLPEMLVPVYHTTWRHIFIVTPWEPQTHRNLSVYLDLVACLAVSDWPEYTASAGRAVCECSAEKGVKRMGKDPVWGIILEELSITTKDFSRNCGSPGRYILLRTQDLPNTKQC
jgi:hypothetical protein